LFEQFFSQLLDEDLLFRLSPTSLSSILLLSLGGSLLALGPLFWGALQIPVASVFQDLPAELKRIQFYYFLPLAIYIVLLTIVLANSIQVGAYFIGALTLITLLALIIYKSMTLLLDRYAHRFSFVNRHAAKTLSRYFVSSFTIFICLLLGMTLSAFIFQLDSSVRAEFTQNSNDKRPDLFAFDIQDSQAAAFTQLMQSQGWQRTLFSPMIRGRLL
jgi:predicted lysophospholipase L1 biosynthesis ABC-type transport system permease subunit